MTVGKQQTRWFFLESGRALGLFRWAVTLLLLLGSSLGCEEAQLGSLQADGASLIQDRLECPAAQSMCEGACVDVQTSMSHCGTCGTACMPGETCVTGSCGTPASCVDEVCSCPDAQKNCDGLCVSTMANNRHCGACGVQCAEGQTCIDGACGVEPNCESGLCSCAADQTDCMGLCVNTNENPAHCGGCGITCHEGQACELGSCVCPGDTLSCNDLCVDTQTDDDNCGGCGTACETGKLCDAGSCVCAEGMMACGTSCVDTMQNPEHCGACDQACASHESCSEGECRYSADECEGDASDITISKVLVYQAVETELYVQDSLVPRAQRTVEIIAEREAMVRVFVEPSPSFSNRELSARFFIQNGETIEAFYSKKVIMGRSEQEQLNSTLNIVIPAESIRADSEFWVELAECDEVTENAGVVGTVRIPERETAPLDAIETGVIRVAFQPLDHDGLLPDTSEEALAPYVRDVERHYPTVRVEHTVLEPVDSGQSGVGVDWVQLLQYRLQPLRDAFELEDDQYLYGLINPASNFNTYCSYFGQYGCTTGIAFVVDQLGFGSAPFRVGVGVAFAREGVGTFTHELGHNHGQGHAPCGVNGDSVDQSYPYSQAMIGVWGYDRDERVLKAPDMHADFMSYCNPSWVSDYAYNRYTDRVAALNGPSVGRSVQGFDAQETQWERMVVTPQGARWMAPVTGPRELFPVAQTGIVYDATGGVAAQVDVYLVEYSEDLGYLLHVPPAQPGWYAVGLKGDIALPY